MSQDLLYALAIFALAILVGFEVISKVPATLHTPLMSGANSIHGIVMVGAMLIAATADSPLSYLLAFVAMVFGAANVVGGYVVTDRMLQMFRRRQQPPAKAEEGASTGSGTTPPSDTPTPSGTPPPSDTPTPTPTPSSGS
jgi:H+-translocating NAD(P) transhydrogenase subunit alpha